MPNNEPSPNTTVRDLGILKYGLVAGQYAQEGERGLAYVEEALNKIGYDESDPRNLVLHRVATSSDQAKLTTAQMFAQRYQEILAEADASLIPEIYKDVWSNKNDDTKRHIQEVFSSYQGKTFGSIQGKLKKASLVLQNESLFSEDEVKEARETMTKNKNFSRYASTLQNMYVTGLSRSIEDTVSNRNLESIVQDAEQND